MGQQRVQHIDIAKGVGIILVVWLHFPILSGLNKFDNWGGVYNEFLYGLVLYVKWRVF